jgi:hypothetical protein
MQSQNGIALKEWAAVCEALATGRQSILLRKGGIDEGPSGFRIEHPEFWLYPTQFHQDESQLTPDGIESLTASRRWTPPPGRVLIPLYGVVRHVVFLRDEAALSALSDLHVLSEPSVLSRFRYRTPGIYVAAVEVFDQDPAVDLAELPRFAGCKSWIELEQPIVTAGVRPIATAPRLGEAVTRLRELAG